MGSNSQFTIRFSDSIPSHIEATNFLNSIGRRKADVIAEALHLYLKEYNITQNTQTVVMPENKPVQREKESVKQAYQIAGESDNTKKHNHIKQHQSETSESVVKAEDTHDAQIVQYANNTEQEPVYRKQPVREPEPEQPKARIFGAEEEIKFSESSESDDLLLKAMGDMDAGDEDFF